MFLVNMWNNNEHNERRIMPRFMVHMNPMLVLQLKILLEMNQQMDFEVAWRYTLIGNLILSLDNASANIRNYPVLAFLGCVFIFYSIYAMPIQRVHEHENHDFHRLYEDDSDDEHENIFSRPNFDNWGQKHGGLLDKKNIKF